MIEKIITQTHQIEIREVIRFPVTSIRMRKLKRIEKTIPWKAPFTKAFSEGIPVQASQVYKKLDIPAGARDFCESTKPSKFSYYGSFISDGFHEYTFVLPVT